MASYLSPTKLQRQKVARTFFPFFKNSIQRNSRIKEDIVNGNLKLNEFLIQTSMGCFYLKPKTEKSLSFLTKYLKWIENMAY